MQDESGTEGTGEGELESIAESSGTHASTYEGEQANQSSYLHPSDYTDGAPMAHKSSKASTTAANRGLNIATDKASRRRSQMMGLPVSPRPPGSSPHSPHTPSKPPASPGNVPASPAHLTP